MITKEKLTFLNQLLDQELNQLTRSNNLQSLHEKISTLESNIQKNIDKQLGSQQSIIERAFPTLGCRDSEEDLTPLKQIQSPVLKSNSIKKKRAKSKIKKKSSEKSDKQKIMQEQQKNAELLQINKEIMKKLKKAESVITELKKHLGECQEYKEKFQKSEYIRTQQKELIVILKREIQQLKSN